MGALVGLAVGVVMWGRRRIGTGYSFGGRRGGGYFRLDEKDGLLGGMGSGKVD